MPEIRSDRQREHIGNRTCTAGDVTIHKFLCKTCGRTFNSRAETIYENIHSDSNKMNEAVECLHEGISVEETAAKVGANPTTIRR